MKILTEKKYNFNKHIRLKVNRVNKYQGMGLRRAGLGSQPYHLFTWKINAEQKKNKEKKRKTQRKIQKKKRKKKGRKKEEKERRKKRKRNEFRIQLCSKERVNPKMQNSALVPGSKF